MMRNKYCFVAVLLLAVAACAAVFSAACKDSREFGEDSEVTVVASFYPVYIAAANVADGIGGIEVLSLSEPQTGCLHDFQMTPEDMKLLSRADLFLANGGGMESFLTDVAMQYPDLPVVETASDVLLPDGNAHAWMSVSRYRTIVSVIAGQMKEIAGEYGEEIEKNAEAYDQKLQALEERQKEIQKTAKGKKILSFHEAYGYLADDYGLDIVYELNLDEERQIGAGEVRDALSAVRKTNASLIFAEELYGRDLAEAVQKEADVKACYLNTLTRGDYSLDSYIDGMRENMDILQEAFGV